MGEGGARHGPLLPPSGAAGQPAAAPNGASRLRRRRLSSRLRTRRRDRDAERHPRPKDAYDLVLEAIDQGLFRPGDRLVESELAERFGMSRTPIREALQRLEAQSVLARDGRSLVVSSLDHDQLGELYVVRAELEGLAARLAAQHAAPRRCGCCWDLVRRDRDLAGSRTGVARQPGVPPPNPPR